MKENVIPFEVQINKLFARKDFQESIEKKLFAGQALSLGRFVFTHYHQ